MNTRKISNKSPIVLLMTVLLICLGLGFTSQGVFASADSSSASSENYPDKAGIKTKIKSGSQIISDAYQEKVEKSKPSNSQPQLISNQSLYRQSLNEDAPTKVLTPLTPQQILSGAQIARDAAMGTIITSLPSGDNGFFDNLAGLPIEVVGNTAPTASVSRISATANAPTATDETPNGIPNWGNSTGKDHLKINWSAQLTVDGGYVQQFGSGGLGPLVNFSTDLYDVIATRLQMKVQVNLPAAINPESVADAIDVSHSEIRASIPDAHGNSNTSSDPDNGDYVIPIYQNGDQTGHVRPSFMVEKNDVDGTQQLFLYIEGLIKGDLNKKIPAPAGGGQYLGDVDSGGAAQKLVNWYTGLTAGHTISVSANFSLDVTKLKMYDRHMSYLDGTLPPVQPESENNGKTYFQIDTKFFGYNNFVKAKRNPNNSYSSGNSAASMMYETAFGDNTVDYGWAAKNAVPFRLNSVYLDSSGVTGNTSYVSIGEKPLAPNSVPTGGFPEGEVNYYNWTTIQSLDEAGVLNKSYQYGLTKDTESKTGKDGGAGDQTALDKFIIQSDSTAQANATMPTWRYYVSPWDQLGKLNTDTLIHQMHHKMS